MNVWSDDYEAFIKLEILFQALDETKERIETGRSKLINSKLLNSPVGYRFGHYIVYFSAAANRKSIYLSIYSDYGHVLLTKGVAGSIWKDIPKEVSDELIFHLDLLR
jgi:hypothetical protein